jgi:tetratricopeptide (TPR) repeat protein
MAEPANAHGQSAGRGSTSPSIRVFISSTFTDMQEERDELVKQVFPQLRALCDSRGVTWGEVDLRWGITDQQADEGMVLPLCLQEIRKCRPYFVGLLGERYGWVPEQWDPELLSQEPWLVRHDGKSVTELEIIHGVLDDPAMADHAFFYFRDPAFRPQRVSQADRPGDTEKLAALKQRIRESGIPVRESYADPRELGQLVLADLTTVINRLFPPGWQPTPLERERRLHEQFARDRSTVYIERKQLFYALDNYASADGPPMAVLGAAGGGKSALLANWALRRTTAQPVPETGGGSRAFTLMHFVAASPDAADWEKMARRIIAEFEGRFGLETHDLPDPASVRERLGEVLRAPTRQKVVLIIDGLNHLEDRDGALELAWLPIRFPADVRLIVSTLPGRPLDEWVRRGWPTLEIGPLDQSEKASLIDRYLKQYAKELPDDVVRHVAATPQTGNPLHLRLMLEELRVYGHHETLRMRLDELLDADDVPTLYSLILSRWEFDYDRAQRALVAEAMVLLWAARRGLSESELRDLLGRGAGPLPHALWTPLYLAAKQTLVNRDGIITFAHDYARMAVEARYTRAVAHRAAVHMHLAEYFTKTYANTLPDGFEELVNAGRWREAVRMLQPHRLFEELPWQVAQAGEWDQLAHLFRPSNFLTLAWSRDKSEVCRYWRDIESHRPGAALRTYERVITSPEQNFGQSHQIALLLDHLGYRKQSLDIYRRLNTASDHPMSAADRALLEVNTASLESDAGQRAGLTNLDAAIDRARSGGADDVVAAGLRNKGAVLFRSGQLQEALSALDEAEAIYRRLDDAGSVASCLEAKAPILDLLGDLGGAFTAFDQVERIYRECADFGALSAALTNHANMLAKHQDFGAAESRLTEALNLAKRLGDDEQLAHVYYVRAVIHWGRDWPACFTELDNCERLARDSGNRTVEANALYVRASAKLALQQWESADQLVAKAALIRRELNDEPGVAQCAELAREIFEQRTARPTQDSEPRPEVDHWAFPRIGDFWEPRTKALLSGAKRLASLSADERVRGLEKLGEKVRTHVRGLDDGWLVAAAWKMVEDLYRSLFGGFQWDRHVADYIRASAGVFIHEFGERGFVLQYVIDNTVPEADLEVILTYGGAIFHAAGLAIVSPQLAALEAMDKAGIPQETSAMSAYMATAMRVADAEVATCQENRRSYVFLNLEASGTAKARVSFDKALSKAHQAGALVILRTLPPTPGSTSEVFLPPGVTFPKSAPRGQ